MAQCIGLNYINIAKDQLNSGREGLFIERHSVHYQIRPGILRFSVHILIGLLVALYLCTKIPLCTVSLVLCSTVWACVIGNTVGSSPVDGLVSLLGF